MLADDEFRDAFAGGVRLVHLLAVKENDDVGVLLDGPGFAQVGEHGPLVGAFLDLAVELREGHDRHVEFLCQGFERAGNIGDFEFARVGAPRGAHQLEVVHDDEPEAVFGLEPPGLRTQFERGDRGGFVDEQGRGAEQVGGLEEAYALGLAQSPGGELILRDFAPQADHALDELALGHFEREDAHGRAFRDGGAHGEVEGEGGLAHAGARRKNNEIGWLQPVGDGVEFGVPGGQAGDAARSRFEHGLHHVAHEFPYGLEPPVLVRLETAMTDCSASSMSPATSREVSKPAETMRAPASMSPRWMALLRTSRA